MFKNLFGKKVKPEIKPEVNTDNNPQVIAASDCCKIPKGWGKEIIIHNSEKYCGKILVFNKGCKFSMHFHIQKQESWYVNKGKFVFSWIDTETAERKSKEMNVGDSVTIHIGLPHQLTALEDGEIFEVSTQHFDYDSYRVEKGTSQDFNEPNETKNKWEWNEVAPYVLGSVKVTKPPTKFMIRKYPHLVQKVKV